MWSRTRYRDCFPEIEGKYNVRIERYNEFDNETFELLSDSEYYEVYDSEDKFMFDVDGAYTDIEFQIEEKLKERLKYEYNE